MAGRLQQLSSAKAGISRLKTKGGADKDSLYDLVNGYVDESGSMQSRPGTTEEYILTAGTKGMCAVNGGITVFSHEVVAGMPSGVTCEAMPHPTDDTATITEIHYAGPFLGDDDGAYLYVSAEFSDGSVFHYWLQRADDWQANTFYKLGQMVQPTVPNGFTYRATRLGDPEVVWAPNVERTVGDVVEPTTPNGYEYTVIDTVGANPKSGTVEPNWPTEDGATINEDTDLSDGSTPSTGTTTPPSTPPVTVVDRYKNPGGNRPVGGVLP